MAMGSTDMSTVTLIPGHLVMTQGADMPIFHVTDWNLSDKTFKNGKKGLRMSVVMKRKIISEMMTTYFPSLLLTAITFATTFFKPFFFEAALGVNLTTMLVMTTIFMSKMEGLPPTSDIKMIDIWLVLCQMVPFAEVVLLTAMEYNREDKKRVKRRKEKRKGKSRNIQTTSLAQCSVDEYQREDDGCRLDGSLSVEMHVEGSKDGGPEEIWCQRCWVPQLKTIGNIPDAFRMSFFV